MKSGHINQYTHLSEFQTVKDFNKSNKHVLELFGHHFTKGERIALLKLIQFSVKIPGVCNARIGKLVQSAQVDQGGISRSTFERMLRKAKSLGIIRIHQTIREKGGYSHNVYVFHRFDGANPKQLTDRPIKKKLDTPSPQNDKKATEASLYKTTKNIKDKELRTTSLETLDVSFVPPTIPNPFVKAVKPFFYCAIEITEIWNRAVMVYRSLRFSDTIESLLPTIIQAFKESVFRFKQRRIKTTFIQYFYGTVSAMLKKEKRKYFDKHMPLMKWMNEELEYE
ncbi:hypothetical protein ACFFHM_00950 [Halalkalibacter kiskunsagensis]|uniref:Transcriptional regulator n=1 Tax=Halalkalibacter kiskunsagensis TaxID=1548599 RepID=A0ABV6KBE8_9BACI